MSDAFDDGLRCPSCQATNESATAGFRLYSPVGNGETFAVIRCKSCRQYYLEVEADTPRYDINYWVVGPIAAKDARAIQANARKCPDPFVPVCDCRGHRFLTRFVYDECPAQWYKVGSTAAGDPDEDLGDDPDFEKMLEDLKALLEEIDETDEDVQVIGGTSPPGRTRRKVTRK